MRIFYVNYDVKNEKIKIKFENGNTKITLEEDEPAREEFYEVLKNSMTLFTGFYGFQFL